MSMRLVEKYRPKRLDEVVGQDDVVKRLKELVAKKTLPHMLFYGPPGCGKTSVAYALANELGFQVYELNASDDRGINVIREKVKVVSQLKGQRIILLDEADNMTAEAQHALRRIMEKGVAIFILTANEEWRIIDPIKSRCAIFRFRKLTKPEILRVVVKVLKAEGVKLDITDEVKNTIYFLVDWADGDLRKILNTLETLITSKGELTVEAIKSLIPPDLALESLKLALDGRWEEALKTLEDLYLRDNLDVYSTIKSLYRAIGKLDVPIHVRLKLYDKLAETERGIKIGCNPLIQMSGFLASVFASIIALKSEGKQ